MEDLLAMLVLQEGKSLLIHMVDGEDTEEVLFQEKTRQKLTGQLHTPQDGLLKIWLPMDSAQESWFKSHTQSESQSP